MKISMRTNRTIVTLGVERQTRDALKKVDDALHQMQMAFNPDSELMNLATGECFSIDELARVRGIISALAEYGEWELRIDEDDR